MAKYADIEPFYDWLVELMRMDTSSHPDHQTLMFYEILDELDSLPEVVRCKDCAKAVRHEVFPWSRRCKVEDCKFSHKETHFCSYGERREVE